jgi:hypothetical protein
MCPHCRLVVCECAHVGTRTIPELEADVRMLMAKCCRIENRGFDTGNERQDIIKRIDNRLDEIALRSSVAELLDAL